MSWNTKSRWALGALALTVVTPLAASTIGACAGDDTGAGREVVATMPSETVDEGVTADVPTDGSGGDANDDGGDQTGDGLDGVAEVDSSTDSTSPSDTDASASCDPACGGGRTCDDGACVCGPGLAECPTRCADLDRDPENCHACGAAAQTEVCNAIDDDCNGTTDDGIAPPPDLCEATNTLGTCVGSWLCEPSGWRCAVAPPATETCDGHDNDCNGATDEGFRDLATGVYESDVACGSCGVDCTRDLGPGDHAHGTCLTAGAAPACGMICCTADDAHPNCDGSDWVDTNGGAGDGCEERVVRSCDTEGDCPQSERCIDQVCTPNVPGGPCEGDLDCALGDVCVGGICGCKGDAYTAGRQVPNVLVVLDRSSSMNEVVGGTNLSKWEVAKAAVRALTEAYEGQVRFGLKLFPGIDQAGTTGGDCGSGVVWLDPALDNAAEINDFLASSSVSQGTPIAEALRSLAGYAGLSDTTRNNYVILITDGRANCDDPVPEVAALLARTPSITTFVIGFGDGVDPAQLSAMASAGGTAQGADGYYQADNPLALGSALDDIVGGLLACEYVLDSVPPDRDGLAVYFDRAPQSLDPGHANGWDYDAATNRVTFFGAACDALVAGAVTDLVFVYGCPNPIIIGGP